MYPDAMKYIITEGREIVIFSPTITHSDMARRTPFGLSRNNITGAGFVRFSDDGAVDCYGESVSLGIKSTGQDSEIVGRQVKRLSDW